MSIAHLSIQGVRNLDNVSLDLHERYNFFIGPNGSGKTSLLEAIYLLGTARSFRTHLYNKVVQHDKAHLTVFGCIHEQDEIDNIGVQKARDGGTEIKINQISCRHSAYLARHLPLQLYYPDSFKIIDATSKVRREILDWGVFHINPDYFKVWAQYQRVLKQRNAWLRGGVRNINIAEWDKLLSDYADKIHQMREDYFQLFLPLFEDVLHDLLSATDTKLLLSVSYSKGWKEESLLDALSHDKDRDMRMGYTHHGPHKADIVFQDNHRLIKDVYSRGQQKLVIMAIKLAQGLLLSQVSNRQCVYLLDDINAEFDDIYFSKVMEYLSKISAQIFLTGVSEQPFHAASWFDQGKLFHVKQGVVD